MILRLTSLFSIHSYAKLSSNPRVCAIGTENVFRTNNFSLLLSFFRIEVFQSHLAIINRYAEDSTMVPAFTG